MYKMWFLMACQHKFTRIYNGPDKICQTNRVSTKNCMLVMYSNCACDVYNTLNQDSWIQGFKFYY